MKYDPEFTPPGCERLSEARKRYLAARRRENVEAGKQPDLNISITTTPDGAWALVRIRYYLEDAGLQERTVASHRWRTGEVSEADVLRWAGQLCRQLYERIQLGEELPQVAWQ